ncbi:MAG: hypothetical protein RL375_3982 [Pseudomonadota bacterium]|jgi:hypothetical protein
MMNRLIWWIERRTPQLAAGAGGALIVGALALHGLIVAPLEQQRLALGSQAARQAATRGATEAQAAADSPPAQLASFYAHFDTAVPLADGLERVHRAAKRLGIELSSADYQLSTPSDRKLARYRMNVNLRASYPQLRRFVSHVLHELPTLALDQIDVQRNEIGDTELEARLSFSFYLPAP